MAVFIYFNLQTFLSALVNFLMLIKLAKHNVKKYIARMTNYIFKFNDSSRVV